MNDLTEALKDLKDVHEPAAIVFWPMAPGWWLLIFLLVASLIGVYYWKKHRKPPYKKLAQTALKQLHNEYELNGDEKMFIQSLSTLIRRIALAVYGRQVSSLTGNQWLKFLNETGNTDAFTVGPGKMLIDAPYQSTPNINVKDLLLITKHWVGSIK